MKRTGRLSRKTRLKTRTPLKRGDSTLGRSTPLARGKSLKRRGVMEVHRDDPDKYGDLFLRVREMPCFGRRFLPGHECRLGYAPASAHHIGDKDSEGMVPCCGRLHDRLHQSESRVDGELFEAGSPPLGEIAKWYVKRAKSS